MTTHYCPSHPCPLCYPGYQPSHYPANYPQYTYWSPLVQHGCICPPGAEKTCQGFGCPRKGITASGTPTRRAETTGSVGEADGGPVAKPDAQTSSKVTP